LCLDFAELQATSGRLMKMKDWVSKLDEFLKVSEKGVLTHAGTVSAEAAARKAEDEFEKYSKERDRKIVSDFDLAVKELEAKNKKRI